MHKSFPKHSATFGYNAKNVFIEIKNDTIYLKVEKDNKRKISPLL